MTLKELEKMTEGEINVLVTSVRTKSTPSGSFQYLTVQDEEGSSRTFLKFDDYLPLKTPIVMKCKMSMNTDKKGNKIAKVTAYEPAEGILPEDFLPKRESSEDFTKCWNFLCQKLKGMRPSLGKLVCVILKAENTKHKGGLNSMFTLPMSALGAFSYEQGILSATMRLVEAAESTAKILRLDQDMMMAAAMLYYIGYGQTSDILEDGEKLDTLYGPGIIAYRRILLASSKVEGIDPNDLDILLHIVLSGTNGQYPAIPEAMALSHLDALIREVEDFNVLTGNEDVDTVVHPNGNRKKRYYKRSPIPSSEEKEEEVKADAKENAAPEKEAAPAERKAEPEAPGPQEETAPEDPAFNRFPDMSFPEFNFDDFNSTPAKEPEKKEAEESYRFEDDFARMIYGQVG